LVGFWFGALDLPFGWFCGCWIGAWVGCAAGVGWFLSGDWLMVGLRLCWVLAIGFDWTGLSQTRFGF
jgi:hypothetical protein